jgi:hypothetical protein
VVQVGIEQGEAALVVDRPLQLLLDAGVAGQAGERRQGPHRLGPAQHAAHPGQQLAMVVRLEHVVVGAGVQALHDVGHGGQHDDAHVGRGQLAPQHPDDLEAVDAGQHHVAQEQVRRFGPGQLQTLLARAGPHDLVAGLDQADLQELGQGRGVLDEEDPLAAGLSGRDPHKLGGVHLL